MKRNNIIYFFIYYLKMDLSLIKTDWLSMIKEILENKNYDYVSNTINPTFPDGLDVEVFDFKTLNTVSPS